MKIFLTLFTLAGVLATLVQAMPTPRFPFSHHHRRSPPQKKEGGNQKLVVAHHMVGNTYPYTQDDWKTDIEQAHAAGIDGFALNIGTDEWQPKQIASA